MRYRVELRRESGVFIPRFRPQEGVRGEMVTRRQHLIDDRWVVYVTIQCEPRPSSIQPIPEAPRLYEPRIIDSPPGEWRLMGWEIVGKAIHCQEWDCFELPPLAGRSR